LIFLVSSGVVKTGFAQEVGRASVKYELLVDLVFYGLLIWGTYLLVSIVPRCKNTSVLVFFKLMDLLFIVYLFVLFIVANKLYGAKAAHDVVVAPVHTFFTLVFLIVNYVIFVILALSLLTSLLKNASSKRPQDETLD
jgi:hypothetical protein